MGSNSFGPCAFPPEQASGPGPYRISDAMNINGLRYVLREDYDALAARCADLESRIYTDNTATLVAAQARIEKLQGDMKALRQHYRQLGAESLGADLREAKDAARYRWLRDTETVYGSIGQPWVVHIQPVHGIPTSVRCRGLELDHSIDKFRQPADSERQS